MSYVYFKALPIFVIVGFFGITDVNGQKVYDKSKILQTTNVTRLHSLKALYKAKSLQKRQRAEQLAARFGWKIKKTDAYGNFMELQEVSVSGKPKYYVTHGHMPFNERAANTTKTSSLWTGGSLGLDLNGEAMRVGAWDGGAVRITHQEFDDNDFQSDGAITISNHATHVAGTIVGLGVNASAKGMASKASLVALDWNRDEAEMAEEAANGLLVSNHSYGWSPLFLATWEFGYYDTQAESWDNIQYNAPYYLIVKSAGNDQNDYNTTKRGYDLVNGASASKNALVVAAVKEVVNYNQPSDVIMSGFSSWGPTDDGRIKPDISAQGVSVFSSYGTGDSDYSTLSGTSMAAPNTTGSLILLQQHYNNLNGVFMKASTLKAVAINTAEEAGDTPGPDYKFGWGLLNAEKAAMLISNKGISAIIEEITLIDRDSYTMSVTSDGLTPLKATLVWTDPPGIPGPVNTIDNRLPMLVNDLDIRITKDTDTYEPWVLDPANPSEQATTGDNVVDNVEGITIDFPGAGNYTITVTHKGILTGGSQEFSLVVNGVRAGPPPVCEAIVPDGLTSDNISDNAVKISWNAITAVGSCDYRYRQTGTAIWTTVNSTANTTDLTGLSLDTDYEFQVRSNCTEVSSAYSTSFNFTTTSIPCVPTTSTSVPVSGITHSSAEVTWNVVAEATGYNYRFRPAGTTTWVSGNSTGNSVTLTGLAQNTIYEYQVQTVCSNGNAVFTESSTFTTDGSAKVDPTSCDVIPRNLSAKTTHTTADISWSPVEDVIGYQYRYRPVAGRSWMRGNTTTNKVSLTGLNPNTSYTFHIRAFCGRFSPIAKMVFSTLRSSGLQVNNSIATNNELISVGNLILYPNPTLDRLNVEMPELENGARVLIYDAKGAQLSEHKLDISRGEINVANLHPGMYYIRIITRSKSIATQFIKK